MLSCEGACKHNFQQLCQTKNPESGTPGLLSGRQGELRWEQIEERANVSELLGRERKKKSIKVTVKMGVVKILTVHLSADASEKPDVREEGGRSAKKPGPLWRK